MNLLQFALYAPRPALFGKTEWERLITDLTASDSTVFLKAVNTILHDPKVEISPKAWLILFFTTYIQSAVLKIPKTSMGWGFWEMKWNALFKTMRFALETKPKNPRTDALDVYTVVLSLWVVGRRKKTVSIECYKTPNFVTLIEKKGNCIVAMVDAVVKLAAK